MQNKLTFIICFIAIMVIGNSNFSAEKNTNVHDIIKVYNRLSNLYEINYIKGDYKKAFNNAKEQLKIDQTSTVKKKK